MLGVRWAPTGRLAKLGLEVATAKTPLIPLARRLWRFAKGQPGPLTSSNSIISGNDPQGGLNVVRTAAKKGGHRLLMAA